MATPRTPNQKKQYDALNSRLLGYSKRIQQLYNKFNREAAKIAERTNYNPDEGKLFHFQDYPQTRAAINDLLNDYVGDMIGLVNSGTSDEWRRSNEFQDLVANKVLTAYGVKNRTGEEFTQYYQNNSDHLKAFQTRTINGMNLSRRVWNLSEQYKQELEMGLSVGIEQGVSAAKLAGELKKYLNEPDKLFRRVRDKFGQLQLSKNARAYHPGRGVYRSSYKNALRLARSEINMAYRTAEQTRWQQFDFVVGYEIKLSHAHEQRMPDGDICDMLAGKYPKDFVWTGWHPNDMCYVVSILKSEDEFWAGENSVSKNEVIDVPEVFKDWCIENRERIEAAEYGGTQPYFIRDNKATINEILNQANNESDANNNKLSFPHYGAAMKLGRNATKAAMKIVVNIGAPILSEIQEANIKELANIIGYPLNEITPMSYLDADQGASNPMRDMANCQSVVVAFEARRRGLNVFALPYSINPNSPSFALGERFQDAWINPKNGKVIEPTIIKGNTDNEIISKLKKQLRSNGRYILGVNEINGRGHVMSIETINNKIVIKDEQTNDFLSIDSLEGISYLEIIRVDKAVFNISKVNSILGF